MREEIGMLPTVTEVLQLEPVRQGAPRVVAGSAGLSNPVRWVHVSEVIDIARELRGGELVLTTGIALPDDASGLSRYLGDLADVGVVGLAVELGRRYSTSLPAALVTAADRRGVVLVELHRGTPFVNITESVHSLIVDSQLAELRASDEVHQIFTELSVEGASAAEVLRQVNEMTAVPVVLENLAHQVLAYETAGGGSEGLLQNWETRSRSVLPATRTAYDEASGWLVTMVGARGHDWGRLVLVLGDTPQPRFTVVLERAASTLALNVLVERDRESLERQTHRTLLTGILSHAYPAAEIAVRARALGVTLENRRLVGVVLRLATSAKTGAARPAGALEAQARLRDATDRAAAAVKAARLTALIGGIDDTTVGILLSLGGREQEEAALDGLTEALQRSGGLDGVVVGAGSVVTGVRDARRTLLEAGQVADAAHRTGGEPRAWYRLPDVRLRGLLHLLRDDARLQTYAERELGPLLAYDAKHGSDLVRALETYLSNGGNKSAAASKAHLSRPAFYERLRKIEHVLGVDLDSVESCLSLHVALLALDSVRSS
jgi:purine catabolism regulator